MNCKQFNNIPLEEVLASLGHLPTKQNGKEAWYLNPFASESQPSFKLSKSLNCWFLFSEGIGGNNTDFIQRYFNYSVKEVLEWASAQNFSSFPKQQQVLFDKAKDTKPNYQINEVKEIENWNLKNYLQERGLSESAYQYVKEITLTVNNKQLYAIGFENQSGGFELRNSFYKGAVLKKDISIIKMNNDHQYYQSKRQNAAVFEGFMDALSFIEMKKHFIGDIIVMNSTSLISKVKEQLKNYSIKALFLDNDDTGLKCKSEILNSFPDAVDCSEIYSDHKDLNDYLIYKMEIKARTTTRTEINSDFQQLSISQAGYSEYTQQQFGNIPESQELIPDDQKEQEEIIKQEKKQQQPEHQNLQGYRRRR
ncbi:hypothetical protein CMU71_12715 [Elizabethkingia anophelis]|uniref:toprim domain-containing protein n=1 Tax=Elizabethkingia anophelis TaxID=1117645 RepID=UPI001F4A4D7C|nr:toprim domain-containing protein [Elizabethkingia anophelis]MDV3567764.1 hypothetical protein [Elizabethkingia anophelis]MDV3969433.1 hypothetical protein [Elizabethkingia anophelis]